MTRVLMTADTVGGVWTYAVELMRSMPDVEFVVATMGARANDAQRAEVPRNARLVESDFKLEWMEEPWGDVARAGEWLLDLERTHTPDLVHLNGYAHAALPLRAPKLVVAHSCVISWWRAVKNENAPPEWDRYRRAVTAGLRAADAVVAPSAWMLGQLDEHYDFRGSKRLIYNGRNGLRPHDGERSGVFAAGRMWDEAKNLRSVLQAAPRLSAPVRIAGDGGASAENVTHLGRLDRAAMQRELSRAAVYLFPAVYEPFGLSILEAALAGCALVIGDIPSLREIWHDAAVFVPPRNASAIVRVTNEVLENDAFRADLARRARERAREFSPERMAAAYAETYERLTWRRVQPPRESSAASEARA